MSGRVGSPTKVGPTIVAPGRPGGRDALVWGGALAAALLTHLALGLLLMTRTAGPADPGETLPAVSIDMAPPASAPVQASPAPPSEAVPESAAPDPTIEQVPDVPEAEVQPPEILSRDVVRETVPDVAMPVVSPAETADAPPQPALDLPLPDLPPPAVVPPNPAVVLPPPPKRVEAPTPKPVPRRPPPVKTVVDRKPPRPVQAQRQAERQVERRPPTREAGIRTAAAPSTLVSGASAASSAAWRSRLVAYLQGRLRYPSGTPSTGAAGVSFSVSRGGQVLSASLSRSSGNPTLDAAALAVVRGAVPPPPSDYTGALSFNIPIRFTQR